MRTEQKCDKDFIRKPHTLVRLGWYSYPIEKLFRKVVVSTHSKMGDFGKKFESTRHFLVNFGQLRKVASTRHSSANFGQPGNVASYTWVTSL